MEEELLGTGWDMKEELVLVKEVIGKFIASSLSQGVRKANIEIELIHHIKKELSKGGH